MALEINGFFPGVLKPDATVGGCIDIYENAWPDPDNTIETVEKICSNDIDVNWIKAPTIDKGTQQNVRTNRMLEISYLARLTDNLILQNVHNQFNMLLLAASIPYCERYSIRENLWHEPYTLLKYEKNEKYDLHYDGGTELGRAVSALVYLNDDYSGGEVEFPNFRIKIKPQAGMLILFPSNYAYSHIAHPVVNGEKYCLVTWLRDRQTNAYL
jgi:predicted 2-oxoglutarate/Fe(II)-dependent dioxygenase YbiX